MSRTRLANNGARFESGDEALDAPMDIPLIDLSESKLNGLPIDHSNI
jgi:hypothetical protein